MREVRLVVNLDIDDHLVRPGIKPLSPETVKKIVESAIRDKLENWNGEIVLQSVVKV